MNGVHFCVLRFFCFFELDSNHDKLLQICIIANLGETVRWTWRAADCRPYEGIFVSDRP